VSIRRSGGGHLAALARLRDPAVKQRQIGIAVAADASRGKVAGLYQDVDKGAAGLTNVLTFGGVAIPGARTAPDCQGVIPLLGRPSGRNRS
jgi:hypothetical protein